jgi:hypothetical protein
MVPFTEECHVTDAAKEKIIRPILSILCGQHHSIKQNTNALIHSTFILLQFTIMTQEAKGCCRSSRWTKLAFVVSQRTNALLSWFNQSEPPRATYNGVSGRILHTSQSSEVCNKSSLHLHHYTALILSKS